MLTRELFYDIIIHRNKQDKSHVVESEALCVPGCLVTGTFCIRSILKALYLDDPLLISTPQMQIHLSVTCLMPYPPLKITNCFRFMYFLPQTPFVTVHGFRGSIRLRDGALF